MLTISDIIFTSTLPLILGISVAVFFNRFVRSTLAAAIGAVGFQW